MANKKMDLINEEKHRFQYIIDQLPLLDDKTGQVGITAKEIEERLEETNFTKISRRQINRILFSLLDDERARAMKEPTSDGREWQWFLMKNKDRRRLTTEEALQLAVLGRPESSSVLPRFIRDKLEDEFRHANSILHARRRAQTENTAKWPEYVRLRRTSTRLAIDREEPKTDPQVEAQVHSALINQKALKVNYRSGHLGIDLPAMVVYPIGLDCQLKWVTLICQVCEKDREQARKLSEKYGADFVQMPVHRIARAEMLEEIEIPASIRFDFTLNHYVKKSEPDRPRGGESFSEGRPILLTALIHEKIVQDFLDSPLTTLKGYPRLKLEHKDNEWWELSAWVYQSDNLLWWCAAMGEHLQVTGPADFRDAVVQFLKRALKPYLTD